MKKEIAHVSENESGAVLAHGTGNLESVVQNSSRRSLLTKGAAAMAGFMAGAARAHITPNASGVLSWHASAPFWNVQNPPSYVVHRANGVLGSTGAPYNPMSNGDPPPVAIGDGETDDTAAIQYAIDYISAHQPDAEGTAIEKGGTVYLPAGTYRISRPIILRQSVTLRGESLGSVTLILANRQELLEIIDTGYYDITVFRHGEDKIPFVIGPGSADSGKLCNDGQNRPLLITEGYATGMALENLVFNGNCTNQNSYADLVRFWGLTVSCYIRNVIITKAHGRALTFSFGADVIVDNLWVIENLIPLGYAAVHFNAEEYGPIYSSTSAILRNVFIEHCSQGTDFYHIGDRSDGLRITNPAIFLATNLHFEGVRNCILIDGGTHISIESLSCHYCGLDNAASVILMEEELPHSLYIGTGFAGEMKHVRWLDCPYSGQGGSFAPLPFADDLPFITRLHLVNYGEGEKVPHIQSESVVLNSLHIAGIALDTDTTGSASLNLYEQAEQYSGSNTPELGNASDIALRGGSTTIPRFFIRQYNGNLTEFGSSFDMWNPGVARASNDVWMAFAAVGTNANSYAEDYIQINKRAQFRVLSTGPELQPEVSDGSFVEKIPSVMLGSGSPVNSKTARFVGHIYIDTASTPKTAWIATATGTGGWIPIG
jgi:hypothetical protein